jgi:hypothetical protein
MKQHEAILKGEKDTIVGKHHVQMQKNRVMIDKEEEVCVGGW